MVHYFHLRTYFFGHLYIDNVFVLKYRRVKILRSVFIIHLYHNCKTVEFIMFLLL